MSMIVATSSRKDGTMYLEVKMRQVRYGQGI